MKIGVENYDITNDNKDKECIRDDDKEYGNNNNKAIIIIKNIIVNDSYNERI